MMGTSSTGGAEALEAYGSRFDPGVPSQTEVVGRRIAITGGRDHNVTRVELVAFYRLWRRLGGAVLIHGAARGVDTDMGIRAKIRGIEVVKVPVDETLDGPWPAAGHRRNWRMLTTKGATALIAFPGFKGTPGCVAAALELGIETWRWDEAAGDFLRIKL